MNKRTIIGLVGATVVATVVGFVGIASLTGYKLTPTNAPLAVDSYDTAQITGTAQFKLVSIDITTGGKTTSVDESTSQELQNAAPLTVVAQDGKIQSYLADGTPNSLIEGTWASARSTSYEGNDLLVDTYKATGTNSNDGSPTETITIVVSNKTTGVVSIHTEFTSKTGTAKMNFDLAPKN